MGREAVRGRGAGWTCGAVATLRAVTAGSQAVALSAALILAAVMSGVACDGSGEVRGKPGSGGDGGAPGSGNTGGSSVSVDIFDDTRVHQVDLKMAPEDWQSILDDSRGDEWRRATVSYDGAVFKDVGVRPSGESSRFVGNVKMSVRLKFDAFVPNGDFQGLEELKLDGLHDDPSLMRERLAYFVLGQRMPAPREVHARLSVNGEARGLYAVEEVWDGDALDGHFPGAHGPLYRIRGLAGFDPYMFRGHDPALYVPAPWDAKGNRPMEDHAVIGRFLERILAGPDAMEEVYDVDLFLEYLAGNAIITNTDGFTGYWEVDDHYQYYDPASGKFKILPWDPDNAFGSINDPPTRSIYENFEKSILTTHVRETSALRKRYRAKLNEYMGQLSAQAVQAKADFIYEQIKDAAHEDTLKTYPNDHFDFSLIYIKDFVAARYADLAFQANPEWTR